MGRPRKPTAKLKAAGNFRKDRHGGREREPTADGAPTKPETLAGEAGKHWDQVVAPLIAAKIAKQIDESALVVLCESWAEYRAAVALEAWDLAEKRQRQMLIASAQRAWRDMAARFGLTPADRARIETQPDGEEKGAGFDDFLPPGAGAT